MDEEKKEYIKVCLQILKQNLKNNGLCLGVAVNPKDYNDIDICFVDTNNVEKDKTPLMDSIVYRISLDEFNKGLV